MVAEEFGRFFIKELVICFAQQLGFLNVHQAFKRGIASQIRAIGVLQPDHIRDGV